MDINNAVRGKGSLKLVKIVVRDILGIIDTTEKFYIPEISLIVVGIHVYITLRGLYTEKENTKDIYGFHRIKH